MVWFLDALFVRMEIKSKQAKEDRRILQSGEVGRFYNGEKWRVLNSCNL